MISRVVEDLKCSFCDKPAAGNYAVHRDGFGEGPEVPLCDVCGSSSEPSLETIWNRLKVKNILKGFQKGKGKTG